MGPTIRVSEETFSLLQAQARPFVDTPEMVIRRLLDAGMANAKSTVEVNEPPRVTRNQNSRAVHRKGPRTIHVLVDNDVVQDGTRIVLVWDRLTEDINLPPTDPIFSARFSSRPTAQKNVIWEFDGNEYSLSELTEKLRDDMGVPLAGGGLNGYWYWGLESKPKVSLVEVAKRYKK